MRKHKKIGVVFSILCLFTLFFNIDVNAEESCTSEAAKSKYSPTAYNKAINYKTRTITISVKDGTFSATAVMSNGFSNTYIVNKNTPLVIEYPNIPNTDLEISISLKLSENDDLCIVNGKNPDNVSYNYKYTVASATNTSTVKNINYDTVCAAFRNGNNYSKYFTKTMVSLSDFNAYNYSVSNNTDKNQYKSLLSYCFNEQVKSNYKEDTVANLIANMINYVKSTHESTLEDPFETNLSFKEKWNSISTIVSDPTKSITNQCSSTNFVKVDNDSYYTNKSEYKSEKITKVNSSCTTDCKEIITVLYGPPVASKAGLCFEYKVKVKSQVVCSANYNGTPPNISDYTVCDAVPRCMSGSNEYDQGGPNEDFDSCINSCDGGKYSQKCIDKCYNKVYKNSNSTKLSVNYNDKIMATRIADASILNDMDYNEATVSAIMDLMQTGNYGKYVKSDDGKKINWVKIGDYYWNNYSTYYYSNYALADKTIRNDQKHNSFLPGEIKGTYSAIGKNGIKVEAGCTDNCDWYPVKGNQFVDISSCKYFNNNDALNAYNKAYKDYEDKKNACTAKASCSSKTSEFTIKVTNKTGSTNNDQTFKDTNQTVSSTSNTCSWKANENSIILDQGGLCYNCKNNDYDYMTEISFPGTWINNKTGTVTYTKPDDIKKWHYKKDKFCSSLYSSDTNVEWWKWYYSDRSSYPVTKIKNDPTADIDNISAIISNFGYFNWNFNVNCFYSLYREPTPGCSGDKCYVEYKNYKFKNITLTNLFPSGTDNSSYNWSSDATNLNNPNYLISPLTLIEDIQSKGNSIYNDSSELEYEVVLDKNLINKIKNYTKSNSFTEYDGTYSISNGVRVYRSTLFRNGSLAGNGSTSGIVKDNTKAGCNNIKNGQCVNFNDTIKNGGK